MSVPSLDFSPEALSDLKTVQQSREYFKAAGLSLQFYEAFCLHRGLRSLVRREVARYSERGKSDRPPDVHPDILERLRLVRDQGGPIVRKLRHYLPEPGAPSLPEIRDMAIALLLSTDQGRDLAAAWLTAPARFEPEARAELKRIVGIVEKYHGVEPVAVPIPAPQPPGGLTALCERGQVSLVWTAAPAAGTYTLKRSTAPEGPYTVLAGNLERPGYIDRIVASGATYYYSVTATQAGQESPPSSPLRVVTPAPPAALSGFEARAGNGRVELRWESSKEATGYRVKRTTMPGGSSEPIGECAETTYVDAFAENGTTYRYAVSAMNEVGESPDSPTVQVRPIGPPPAPTALEATPVGGAVSLEWAAATEAEHYIVKRAPAREGRYASIASRITGTAYSDTTVANGTTYFYAVAAVNAAGESADCAAVRASTVEPPAAPVGLSAFQMKGTLVLSWTPSRGATSYAVKRGSSPGGPYTTVAAKLSQPTVKDLKVIPGVTYFYVVQAVNAGGPSPESSELSIRVEASPPAPTGLSAASVNGGIALKWNPTSRAIRYQVKRSESRDGPYASLAELQHPSYADRDVDIGKDYLYVVSVATAGGDSPDSSPVSARLGSIPEAPKEVKAAPGNGRVALSWVASKGATSYYVQRSERNGAFSTIATIAASTSYGDESVTNGVLYEYAILAVSVEGQSPSSNVARVTPIAPPPAPTGLEQSPGDGRVLLTWTAVKGAVSYVVKRSTAAGGPFAAIANTTERTYTDDSVVNGTAYRYVVAAVNGSGESPDSAEIQATSVEPPSAPVGLIAMAGDRQVSIAWFATPGASSYSLKRATTPDGPYLTVAKPTEPSYVDGDVENRMKYYYVVNAFNAAGRSSNSDRVEATPMPQGF